MECPVIISCRLLRVYDGNKELVIDFYFFVLPAFVTLEGSRHFICRHIIFTSHCWLWYQIFRGLIQSRVVAALNACESCKWQRNMSVCKLVLLTHFSYWIEYIIVFNFSKGRYTWEARHENSDQVVQGVLREGHLRMAQCPLISRFGIWNIML